MLFYDGLKLLLFCGHLKLYVHIVSQPNVWVLAGAYCFLFMAELIPTAHRCCFYKAVHKLILSELVTLNQIQNTAPVVDFFGYLYLSPLPFNVPFLKIKNFFLPTLVKVVYS